jgi:DNA-binding LacI/PurR family transcriptional regulator
MGERATSTRRVTQADVARRVGVSRSVVSYVLNAGSRTVAPETRDKILNAIAELGYRPNKHAQNLMRTKYNVVAHRQFGIVLSDVFMLRRPYYADILAGMHATAHRHHHRIQFIRFYEELKDPILFNALIHDEEISGLILIALDQHMDQEEDFALIREIQARIDNIVCVEWRWEGISSVSFDRQEAAYKAASHLLSLGNRDIVYVGQTDNRVLGFRQAIAEFDVTVDAGDIVNGATVHAGFAAAAELFRRRPIPEAILGGSDEVTIGVLRYLDSKGIAVPDRVALASIDNIEMSEFSNPPLTTVNVQTTEMGTYAVQLLMDMASGPRAPASIILPTQLIVRESSGGPVRSPGETGDSNTD